MRPIAAERPRSEVVDVRPLRIGMPVLVLLLAGCGSSSPSQTSPTTSGVPSPPSAPSMTAEASRGPSPADSSTARELESGSASLPPGRYTRSAFRPPVTLQIPDGWFVGSLAPGFFDVQQLQGTPDVIGVQFGLVDGIVGPAAAMETPTSAAGAARSIHSNPGVTVIEESESRIGGHTGSNVIVENRTGATSPVLRVAAGTLGIDPKRRLWISLFDTPDGILAIMVGGSVARWQAALDAAEPLLESITIGS